MVKAVLLVLVVMGVIAMIGNAIQPGFAARQLRKRFGGVCARCNKPQATCHCKKA